MRLDYGAWCVLGVLLVVLAGAAAAAACARGRRRPLSIEEQRRLLQALRAGLLASPSLSRRHPDAARVLRSWKLVPSSALARTDATTRSIHMPVADASGRPYDRVTLILVLLHELAHATDAAPALEHDGAWARRQASYVAAAVEDGLVLPWQEPDPAYPALVLPDAQRPLEGARR
jgi:hypothetical protein